MHMKNRLISATYYLKISMTYKKGKKIYFSLTQNQVWMFWSAGFLGLSTKQWLWSPGCSHFQVYASVIHPEPVRGEEKKKKHLLKAFLPCKWHTTLATFYQPEQVIGLHLHANVGAGKHIDHVFDLCVCNPWLHII